MSPKMKRFGIYFEGRLIHETFQMPTLEEDDIRRKVVISSVTPLTLKELEAKISKPLPPMKISRDTCGACKFFKHITKDTPISEWSTQGCKNSKSGVYNITISISTEKCKLYEEVSMLPVEFYLG